MNALMLELLPWVKQGYCCSQLLAILYGEAKGENSPLLLRAMEGLCHGVGQSGASCGLLTGGACVLGCVGGKGGPGELSHADLPSLLNDYGMWFQERTAAYGGTACPQVMAGVAAQAGGKEHDMTLCGDLLAECWEKLLQLMEDYQIELR